MSGSQTGVLKFFEVKQRKMNVMTDDPKRNWTWVDGLVSDTDDHCTTGTRQQVRIFKVFIELPLALLKANPKQANRRAI